MSLRFHFGSDRNCFVVTTPRKVSRTSAFTSRKQIPINNSVSRFPEKPFVAGYHILEAAFRNDPRARRGRQTKLRHAIAPFMPSPWTLLPDPLTTISGFGSGSFATFFLPLASISIYFRQFQGSKTHPHHTLTIKPERRLSR